MIRFSSNASPHTVYRARQKINDRKNSISLEIVVNISAKFIVLT